MTRSMRCASAMARLDALLDSNVVIALLIEAHQHHAASLALIEQEGDLGYAVSAHSYAEVYSTLTRRGERAPFQLSPADAWAALESVRAVTQLVGLTASQTFDTVRKYAQGAGIGARLYDRLIGEAAIVHEIPMIVTWNIGHMRGLFSDRKVVTPTDLAATL